MRKKDNFDKVWCVSVPDHTWIENGFLNTINFLILVNLPKNEACYALCSVVLHSVVLRGQTVFLILDEGNGLV